MNTDSLAHAAPSQMIPGDFAEKAMASLMQMHSELMDEKERRVELFRKLMEREQTVAELRMYVRVLEEKMQKSEPAPAPAPAPVPVVTAAPAPLPRAPLTVEIPSMPSAYTLAPEVAPPLPPRVARPRVEGWKTW